MFQQIISLINVHLKEFFREPGIIFWAILFPILMAWGLGLAFTKKGELLRTVALVQEEEAENRQWTSFMENEAYSAESEEQRKLGNEALGITTYRFVAAPWDEAVIMLKRGKTDLILQVSADSLRYHFDPLNPEAQLTYLQLSSALNGFDMPEHKARIKPLEQKGTRYIDFLVPGLMAMGVMMSCMWGISYNNVDKRGKKLMRRMVATPMKKSSYLIAQFSSRLLLSGVESLLLLLFTWLYFDTEIQGSIPALFLMFLVGNMAFTGIAILVSSRTDNNQVANGLINLVVMPMMIMSGIFFSYHNFPDWMVSVIRLMPLTMLADEMRNIFTEGAGLLEVYPQALILATIGVVLFIAGLRVYKWY